MKKFLIGLLLLTMGFFPGILFGGNLEIAKVGEWGTGRYRHVFIQGNYAYCTADRAGFDIIDISSPSHPRKVGNIVIEGYAIDVHVKGDYAYVTFGTNIYRRDALGGLLVIDITHPSCPVLVGTYETSETNAIYVKDNYAYVISSNKLKIIDVTTPSSPALLAVYDVDHGPEDVYVRGNYAYVATDKGPSDDDYVSLDIFDVSNPGKPGLVGTFESNHFEDVSALDVEGNYAYLLSLGGLTVVDVSNPAAPAEVGRIGSYYPSGNNDIQISGNYAYIVSFNYGLQVIDISDPASPTTIGTWETYGGGGVYLSGNDAYMAADYNGLQVIDVSNPGSPGRRGYYDTSGNAKGLDFSGNHVYLMHSNGLQVIDVSEPTSPTLAGNVYTQGNAENVYVCGNYAYVVSQGLKIIHIPNTTSPVQVGKYDAQNHTADVYVVGNYAYTACRQGLHIVDISNPTYPTFVGAYNLDPLDEPTGIFIRDNYAFLMETYGLIVFNISNPSTPTLVSTSKTPGYGSGVITRGNYAYVADGYAGLQVFDVSHPDSLAIVGNYDTPGSANAVYVMGNYAYVADGSSGLLVIDVSNPASPLKVANFDTPGNVVDVHASGDYIYAADGDSGKLFILKSYDPTASPRIELDHSKLSFASINSLVTPPTRSFLIGNSGGGTLNWSAAVDRDWLHCSPASGTNSGEVLVSVDVTGLPVGSYFGTITISDPFAINSHQTAAVTLKVYESGQTSAPFGLYETPMDNCQVSGSIPVTGWVLDDIGMQSVQIFREEGENLVYIGDAVFVEGARPDVEQAFPWYPSNHKAGWGYMMLTHFLPNEGNGAFNIQAIATDLEGNQVTLGIKTIIGENAKAVKPFGTIDTPEPGSVASGSEYINWGWALTPQPNTIPTHGATITVWVDGVSRGHPDYNLYREDIALLFPGYNNSNGAAGCFSLDTTQYTNGVHTISWSVTDDTGNTDGIGSRYFSVRNSTQSIERTAQSVSFKTPDLSKIPLDYSQPLWIKTGYDPAVKPQNIYPGKNGISSIKIEELGRIVIFLNRDRDNHSSLSTHHSSLLYTGYLVVGNRLRPLPIGSFLDKNSGVFYWHPGAGFVGNYQFVFIIGDQYGNKTMKKAPVTVVPKFSKFVSPGVKMKEEIK